MSSEYEAYLDWREANGLSSLAPRTSGVERSQHLFSLSKSAWGGIQDLAIHHGYIYGMKPNVTAMLEALGKGLFILTKVDNDNDK